MKLRHHIIWLFFPLAVWTFWFGVREVREWVLSPHFKSIDKLAWGNGDALVKINIQHSRSGETEGFKVLITDHAGNVLKSIHYEIDWDMGGGGFVQSSQMDNDPDLEVVFAKKGYPDNFFLDLSDGRIEKKALETASPSAQERVAKWMALQVPNPFAIGLSFIVTVLFYIAYFPLVMTYQWFRRKNRKG